MTPQIERTIAKGKPLSVIKKLVKEELLRLDKAKFDADIKAEYDELFPRYRDMTDSEILAYDDENFGGDTGVVKPEDFEYPQVERNYSEDENYKTFEEYKNETRIVSEAVYEDEFIGNINVGRKRISPEVTELVRPYTPIEVTDEMIQAELDKLGYVPKEKVEAQKYLNDTDWYVVRQAETGVEIPQEVLDKRTECREIL
jgi:hypothetical protein